MLNRFNLKLLTGAHDSFWLINQFLLTATEMQHFLLYFGLPLLKGVLDGDHFHHLALLTTGLWIFLKNEISREELALAGEIMRSFAVSWNHSMVIIYHHTISINTRIKRNSFLCGMLSVLGKEVITKSNGSLLGLFPLFICLPVCKYWNLVPSNIVIIMCALSGNRK